MTTAGGKCCEAELEDTDAIVRTVKALCGGRLGALKKYFVAPHLAVAHVLEHEQHLAIQKLKDL